MFKQSERLFNTNISRAGSGRKKKNAFPIIALIAFAALIYALSSSVKSGAANGGQPLLGAKAAILLDAATGEVLYEVNADEAMPPASMSKMMTELIVLEQINGKHISWKDKVTISRYSAEVPGSQMGALEGESYTVRELFDAVVIHSANDAAVALAEHISGSEEKFAALMNDRASKLQLSANTYFANATGLNNADLIAFHEAFSSSNTMMTASDAAKLAGYLIKKYPEVLEISSRSSLKLEGLSKVLPATNQMLKGGSFYYPGNDGFKTGYTPEAGYCFTGTAIQDGRRLISVVMGVGSSDQRFEDTAKLFKFGYNNKQAAIPLLTKWFN